MSEHGDTKSAAEPSSKGDEPQGAGGESGPAAKATATEKSLSASAPPKPRTSAPPSDTQPQSSPAPARRSVPRPSSVMPKEMETMTPPPISAKARKRGRPTNPTESLASALSEKLDSPLSVGLQGAASAVGSPPSEPALFETHSQDRTEPNEAFAAVKLRPAQDRGFGLKPGQMWSDERLCSEHLSEQGQVSAWAERAEWFETEAATATDPSSRARLLLVASEHWAMIGNLPQARQTAEDANRHGGELGLRQARGIAAAEGDYDAVKGVLTGEAHASATPAARAHAAFFNAEVERHLLEQPENAQRHLDQAASADSGDPRAALQRLVTQLQSGSAASNVRWPNSEQDKPLIEAATLLAHLHNNSEAVQGDHSERDPVLAFIGARNALFGRDRTEAALHLKNLASAEGFERSTLWLAQALLAPEPTGRKQSLTELKALANLGLTPTLQRSIASRALELGDREAAELALTSPAQSADGHPAFSHTDQIAISALSGRHHPALTDWLEESLKSDATRPLALGVSAALSLGVVLRRATETGQATPPALSTPPPPSRPCKGTDDDASKKEAMPPQTSGAPEEEVSAAEPDADRPPTSATSPEALALQQLAYYLSLEPHPRWRDENHPLTDYGERLLANVGELLERDWEPGEQQTAAHSDKHFFRQQPLTALLGLELAQAKNDTEQLVRHLLAWPTEDLAQVAQAHFVAGALFESDGAVDAAIQHYSQALSEKLVSEPSVRALSDLLPAQRFDKLLQGFASKVKDDQQRALLLTEAALALDDESEERGEEIAALLEQAEAQFKGLAPVHFLRAQRDTSASLAAPKAAAEEAGSNYSQALTLCRQALHSNPAASTAALYRRALELCPKDLALLDQAVRFDAVSAQERAQYEALAAKTARDPLSRKRLTRSSTRQLPHVLETDAAAELAPGPTPSAGLAAAPSDKSEPLDAERGTSAADENFLQLARTKRLAGDETGEYRLLKLAREQEPQSLEVLQRLEFLALRQQDEDALLSHLDGLAKILPKPDATGHALMAARIAKRVKGWSATLPHLKRAYDGETTSLWTLRELQAQTRTENDSALRQQVCEHIAKQTGHPLDKAALLLQAANAACAQNELTQAMTLAREAARLAPADLVVQSHAAQLIELGGDPAVAAASYERLAGLSNLTEHKVDALQSAARLGANGGTDPERAIANLERAVSLLPTRAALYEPLAELYQSTHQLAKLSALLDTQLSHTTDAQTRSQIQVRRGQILTQLGDATAAKTALNEVLRVQPNNPDALSELAALSGEAGDPNASEQALLQLVRLSPDPDLQADGYLKLARLYAAELDNIERAERCFFEVLRRRTGDLDTLQEMLPLYNRLGRPGRAVDLIEERLATSSDERSQRRLQLMLVTTYDSILQDKNAAETTLLLALRAWPLDADVLRVAADYYQRTGQNGELDSLQQEQARALMDRFDDLDFSADRVEAIGTLAECVSDTLRAEVAFSVAAALRGESKRFNGRQVKALDDALDDLLAPSALDETLRALLARTGEALELARPLDLESLGAKALPEQLASWQQTANEWATELGMQPPQVFLSESPSPIISCAGGQTPCILLSRALTAAGEPTLVEFALYYGLKLIKTNLAALARQQPGDGLSAMHALVGCVLHGEATSERDDVRASEERMLSFVKKNTDSEVLAWAKEVMGQLPANGTKLGQAARAWATRVAIAATGATDAALRLHIASHNSRTLPQSVGESVSSELIGKHPALQDVVRAPLSGAFIQALQHIDS